MAANDASILHREELGLAWPVWMINKRVHMRGTAKNSFITYPKRKK